MLDWELCTLGDPLADLGHLGVYWFDPVASAGITSDPTAAGGFPSYDDLVSDTPRAAAVRSVGYYRGFAAWRLAIIAEGVASRHREHHPEDAEALRGSQAAVNRLIVPAELLDRLPA